MTKERQLRKQEEIRNSILDTARDIILKEGINSLSIRKITNAIGYSPAIVYHYFKDKNEIIETLTGEGYQKILSTINLAKKNEHEPEMEIKEIFTSYIKAAINSPDIYKAFMLNDAPLVKQKTAILEKGISQRSKTIGALCEIISRGITQGRFKDCNVELTAQILWTAAFGLIIKFIIENEISEEQINCLIDHHFKILFYGIMARKEGEYGSNNTGK